MRCVKCGEATYAATAAITGDLLCREHYYVAAARAVKAPRVELDPVLRRMIAIEMRKILGWQIVGRNAA